MSKNQNAINELKTRLMFVLFGLLVFRIGAHVPTPGVDVLKLTEIFKQQSHGILGLFNMFSGGALGKLTIFALGVMPYISSSIMMQLFSAAIPHLEQLKKQGDSGRRKISQYTRYLTVVLSLLQSFGICQWLWHQQLVVMNSRVVFTILAISTLTTGTMFLMWLGEQMTERGLGNGISLIIFTGIISRLPQTFSSISTQVHQGQMSMISMFVLMLLFVSIFFLVVFVERGLRKIPIHYPKRQQGRQMMMGGKSVLPLKINMAGVIPPIFATSIIVFPTTMLNMFASKVSWLSMVSFWLSPNQPLYVLLYVMAIFFFCFFYTTLVFNSNETADQLKKSGALVPGIRPGNSTAVYIDNILSKLTLAGAVYLSVVSLVPQFLTMAWHVPFSFGGTAILIIVVVVMDFISQAQSLMMGQQYEKYVKKTDGKGKVSLLH